MHDTAEAYRILIADVYELAGLSRSTSASVAASFGTTVARWHVMSVVSAGPASVPGIAARLGLARQSVQRVVDHLVRTGLLTTSDNPAHARSPLLCLAPDGQALLASLVAASDEARAAALKTAGVSASQLHEARATVRALLLGLTRAQPGRRRRTLP